MGDDEKPTVKQTFKIASCKTESVVVYLDRAEVKRSLKTKLRAGENEIILNDLSQYINKDTVRVDGHGEATISEVALTVKHVAPVTDEGKKRKEDKLQAELEALQHRLNVLQVKRTRLVKQRQVLDGFADQLTNGRAANEKSALNSELLQGIGGFFDLYDDKAVKLDENIQDVDLEVKTVTRDIATAQKNLNELNFVQRVEENEILILLEAEKDVEVELFVSYVVTNAKWSPKYDIRVFGSEKQMKLMYYGVIQQSTGEDWLDTKIFLSTATPSVGGTVPELGTMRLKFKEKIAGGDVFEYRSPTRLHQHEPYIEFKRKSFSEDESSKGAGGMLALRNVGKRISKKLTIPYHKPGSSPSAASKSPGAEKKEPTVDSATNGSLEPEPVTPSGVAAGDGGSQEHVEASPSATEAQEDHSQVAVQETADEPQATAAAAAPTVATGSGGDFEIVESVRAAANGAQDPAPDDVHESIVTAMYEIARRATVPSDNVSHKVSVAIINFEPSFEYESVPKKVPYVFLKARVKNTSSYALLAGPANIYLDNSYIAKSELAAVSPSEEFTCSLGVDPSIKINYKPINKYREHSGIISKVHVMTYRQQIEVKNTRQAPCKILVSDQLPQSTLDKIKVTLIEPSISQKEKDKSDSKKPTRINNATNNVEWEFELAAGETKELTLKYSVEHPASEEIESTVTYTDADGTRPSTSD